MIKIRALFLDCICLLACASPLFFQPTPAAAAEGSYPAIVVPDNKIGPSQDCVCKGLDAKGCIISDSQWENNGCKGDKNGLTCTIDKDRYDCPTSSGSACGDGRCFVFVKRGGANVCTINLGCESKGATGANNGHGF